MPSAGATDALHTIETEMAVLMRSLELLSRRGRIHRHMDRAGYLLLRTLDETGPLCINSLAERVGLDGSTVTRQVAALERDGFARRRIDTTDRRSSIVASSARGRALMHQVQEQRRDRVDGLLAGWTDAERVELGRMLAKLNRSITVHVLEEGAVEGSAAAGS